MQPGAVDAWDEDIADATVLHLRGEVDLVTTPLFRERLSVLVSRRRHIIADFSQIEYFGMSGVRVLEEVHAVCAREGRRVDRRRRPGYDPPDLHNRRTRPDDSGCRHPRGCPQALARVVSIVAGGVRRLVA